MLRSAPATTPGRSRDFCSFSSAVSEARSACVCVTLARVSRCCKSFCWLVSSTFQWRLGPTMLETCAARDRLTPTRKQKMPAPAAPRKRGALTSSTAPKTAQVKDSAATTRTAASRRVASTPEADLVNRLEQVSLGNNAATRRPIAGTSRLQARETTSTKLTSVTPKATASQKAISPPESLETLLSSVNNTLARLSAARKATPQPFSTSSTFVNNVKIAYKEVSVHLAKLRKLASSSDETGQSLARTRLLSVERAAILLVSHCIDACLVSANTNRLSYGCLSGTDARP